jgi:hypothetical protein
MTYKLKLIEILPQIEAQAKAQGVKINNLKDFQHTIKLLMKKN